MFPFPVFNVLLRSLVLLLLLLRLCRPTVGAGRKVFECPQGYYLSRFVSAYNSLGRFYDFDCRQFPHSDVNEQCSLSDVASDSADIYLTCQDNQYAAGVSVVNNLNDNRWTLLCCQSGQVKIQSNNCKSLPFLNDYKQDFDFALSNGSLVRKFQSIYDEKVKDRQWWFQTCPYSLVEQPTIQLSIDGLSIGSNRFDVRTVDDSPITDLPAKNPPVVGSSSTSTVVVDTSTATASASTSSPAAESTAAQTTAATSSSMTPSIVTRSKVTPEVAATSKSSSVERSASIDDGSSSSDNNNNNNKPNDYDAYYDHGTDTNKLSGLPSSANGDDGQTKMDQFFSKVHSVFKNIQDGLVFAQWWLSSTSNTFSDDPNARPPEKSVPEKPAPAFVQARPEELLDDNKRPATNPSSSSDSDEEGIRLR